MQQNLTERQRMVCVLVAEGLANKQIAAALRISVHTVDSHVRRLFELFQVRSRVLLAVRFVTAQVSTPRRRV